MNPEENMADNVAVENTAEPTSPVEASDSLQDATKAFSERLKKEKIKIKQEAELEAKNELAKEAGFDTWDEYQKNKRNEKIENMGFNPEQLAPIFEEFLKHDPRYINLSEKEKQLKEQEESLKLSEDISKVNTKFNTNIKSIDDLDVPTIDLWKKGLSLEKAYAAEHYEEINLKINKAAIDNANSKNHKVGINSTGKATELRRPTEAEKAVFNAWYPDMTDDDILSWYNKK